MVGFVETHSIELIFVPSIAEFEPPVITQYNSFLVEYLAYSIPTTTTIRSCYGPIFSAAALGSFCGPSAGKVISEFSFLVRSFSAVRLDTKEWTEAICCAFFLFFKYAVIVYDLNSRFNCTVFMISSLSVDFTGSLIRIHRFIETI
jgi:hypothetical protein